jgi:hypothetical protein
MSNLSPDFKGIFFLSSLPHSPFTLLFMTASPVRKRMDIWNGMFFDSSPAPSADRLIEMLDE